MARATFGLFFLILVTKLQFGAVIAVGYTAVDAVGISLVDNAMELYLTLQCNTEA